MQRAAELAAATDPQNSASVVASSPFAARAPETRRQHARRWITRWRSPPGQKLRISSPTRARSWPRCSSSIRRSSGFRESPTKTHPSGAPLQRSTNAILSAPRTRWPSSGVRARRCTYGFEPDVDYSKTGASMRASANWSTRSPSTAASARRGSWRDEALLAGAEQRTA